MRIHRLKKLVASSVCLLILASCPVSSFGQAGLRESLERMDRDQDGTIDPDEVTTLSRPYLERILKGRSSRNPFERPIPISKIQEAARIYFALKNGVAGTRVYAEPKDSLKPFGPADDEPMVPGFGLGQIKYPYTPDDIEEAEDTIDRCDRNDDGFIDRREASRNRWTHRNPFDDDFNKDNQLSVMELAQRYARRRLLASDAGELVQRAKRTGGDIRPSTPTRNRRSSDWWREGGSDFWLTASLMSRFDNNRNGRLESDEAIQTGLPVGMIDLDRDGEIVRDELFEYVGAMQRKAGNATEGLPGWFYELDTNTDQQVALSEFASSGEWSVARREEFARYDLNSDGLLTAEEVLQSNSVTGGSYQNTEAIVLPPKRTMISEIEVDDDFPIRQLTVQISVTHTSTGQLDAFLTGPNGERVELFTEVGGGGNNFENTTFDDKSEAPVTKAKPPFEGSYRPEAVDRRQPGLAQFNGKSVKGIWQLVIRGSRSDRFGMLHSWGLTVTPEETDIRDAIAVEETATVEAGDSESDPKAQPQAAAKLPAATQPPNGAAKEKSGLGSFLDAFK